MGGWVVGAHIDAVCDDDDDEDDDGSDHDHDHDHDHDRGDRRDTQSTTAAACGWWYLTRARNDEMDLLV